MTKMKQRFRAACLAATIAPALAFAATTTTSTTAHAANFEKASCQVHAVLAKNEGDGGIPKNLAFLATELGSPAFGAFKTFVLLGTKSFSLDKGKAQTQTLASGHPISLALRSADDKQIKLHVKLGQASGKTLVDTDYTVKPNGFVLFAASHKQGSVIFAVQCHGK